MTFFFNIEKILKDQGERALEIALHYYGLPLRLMRPDTNNVYAKVHGKHAGGTLVQIKTFIGIIKPDDFAPTDGVYSAGMEEGFMYTKETDIKTGDVIQIDMDGGHAQWRVEAKEDIGYNESVSIRWRLSNRL